MVSWVPQILIPPLVALAFLRSLPRRWVMLMAPTTFLADVDYFIPERWAAGLGMAHFHRVVTHTLVVPALLFGALFLVWRSKARPKGLPFWAFVRTPGWPLAGLLICYYLMAHAVMDVFTGGVVLFWPLWDLNVYFDLSINLNLQTHELIPTVEPGTSQGPSQLDPNYPWFTNEHAAMLAMVAAFFACVGLHRLWARKAGAGKADGRPESPEPSTKGK